MSIAGMTQEGHHVLRFANMEPQRTESIYPTPEEINALPDNVQRYIRDLIARFNEVDARTVLQIAEERDALVGEVEELKATIALLNHPERIA
jgi:hypothetical protein